MVYIILNVPDAFKWSKNSVVMRVKMALNRVKDNLVSTNVLKSLSLLLQFKTKKLLAKFMDFLL